MGKRLASSKERRLQTFRRELVIDLFTRHGVFWDRVQWIRQLQHIEAVRQMPPLLEPNQVHLPPHLPKDRRRWGRNQREQLQDWMMLLHVLHDAVIPEALRIETPYSFSLDFWMGFLSACAVFDPPEDNLLGFAEHGVAAYGDFINPFHPWDDGDGPEMLASPIVFLPDPEQLLADERERFDWVIGKLQDSLTRQDRMGTEDIDLREMAAHFEHTYQSERERAAHKHDEPPAIPTKPYIAVDEHTTETDVRHAFRMMAARLPKRPRPLRPKRDPLTAIQCAVWHDDCHWSHERIARTMGWAVQHPPGVKSRSETARQYINEGRAFLNQRNAAA
jgi:hypothetical protein